MNNEFNSYNENNENNINDNAVQGDNFIMRTDNEQNNTYVGQSYVVNETQSNSTVDADFKNVSEQSYQDYVSSVSKKKKKGGFNKRIFSYILVGVLCTTIGGVASGAASLYLLPKTDFFKNTALYQQISTETGTKTASSSYDVHPTTFASTGEAMTVTDIAKKVGPAVVGVSVKSVVSNGSYYGGQSVQEGMGSGIIINSDGYILTNYHVISGATEVKVILYTGKEVSAKVVNYDSSSDIAVVKITDKITMPGIAELGDSSTLQVGESVVAIGNPLGKEFLGTVTTGVVSALNRKIETSSNISYIQTNAAINAGNSGGPLLNSRGQVIGINTAKINETGVEGLGFSIPINDVKGKIDNLSKPILMIGISGEEVTDTAAQKYSLPVGVLIDSVETGSPAQRAGLKVGDIITKFDCQSVKTVSDINTIKTKHKSGDTVKVTVVREDGSTANLDLKLTASN